MSDMSEMTQTEELIAVEQSSRPGRQNECHSRTSRRRRSRRTTPSSTARRASEEWDLNERICELRLALGLPLKKG